LKVQMVRWAATHRLARGPYATIVNSAGDRHHTGGIGAQDGGGVGTGVGMANLSDPQNHTSVHHTHLMMWGHRAAPLGTRYGRAALCAWVPRQRLWGCGSRAKVQARATVTSSPSGSVAAKLHTARLESVVFAGTLYSRATQARGIKAWGRSFSDPNPGGGGPSLQ